MMARLALQSKLHPLGAPPTQAGGTPFASRCEGGRRGKTNAHSRMDNSLVCAISPVHFLTHSLTRRHDGGPHRARRASDQWAIASIAVCRVCGKVRSAVGRSCTWLRHRMFRSYLPLCVSTPPRGLLPTPKRTHPLPPHTQGQGRWPSASAQALTAGCRQTQPAPKPGRHAGL